MSRTLLLVLLLPALSLASRVISNVHLALLSDATQMNVQWVTGPGEILGNGTSTVQWGPSPRSSLPFSTLGYNWTYSFSGRNYTFNAGVMTGLTPGQTYFYRVGDPIDGWSSVFSFQATRTDFSEAPLRMAWFGDMGWYNAQSLPYLQTEAMEGNMDLYVHVGDYAYDLQYLNGTVGDMFQASIEPITSTVPYMGCVGNVSTRGSLHGSPCPMAWGTAHSDPLLLPPSPLTQHEYADNEAMYMNRFRVFVGNTSNGGLTPPNVDGVQAGEPNNLYYSFEIGLAHIATVSTEMYFTTGGAAPQYAWLEQDLASIDRKKTPWVIVYGHRSIYCSCDSDCDGDATAVREGQYGLEALMNQYGVDLW
jgi:acid phosphatase type 7